MNKHIKAFTASLLAVSVLMPAVTSCGKTEGTGEIISDDTPWYNITTIELDADIDKNEYEYYEVAYVGEVEGNYLFLAEGMKNLGGVDYSTVDLNDYITEELQIIDSTGAKTATIDLAAAVKEAGLGDLSVVSSVVQIGDEIRVVADSLTSDYESNGSYAANIDVASGTVGEFSLLNNPYSEDLNTEGASLEASMFCNGYMIEPYWIYGDTPSYVLTLCDEQNNYTMIDLREELPNEDIYDISDIFDVGDNKALVIGTRSSGARVNLILDFTNMSVAFASEEEYGWLSIDSTSRTSEIEGYGRVIADKSGISRVDFDTKSVEKIMDFSECNINYSDALNLTPVDIQGDRIVLTGSIFRMAYSNYEYESVMVFLDKAESNPNVGKQILNLASITEPSYALCEAICNFNENNTEYYIKIDDRYSMDSYFNNEELEDEGDNRIREDRASASLSSQLSVDLMGGVGPDIIVNAYSFSQLNNPDYLVDLNDYVQENLLPENYYRNIIDSGYIGDSVFQLPVTFDVEGIATDASNVNDGQVGFTFEEYAVFVDQVCNGYDPMNMGKTEFFVAALNSMMDLMVDEEGNFNFDNEAFRALAQYAHDDVLENLEDEERGSSSEASLVYAGSVADYFENVGSDKVLLGFPSYDGRGPIVSANDSIAISAQSGGIEGCTQFLDLVMSPEQQILFGAQSGVPVSREAFFEISDRYIEGHNALIETLRSYIPEAELRLYGYNTIPADSEVTEEFNELINNLDGYNASSDGAVNTIIREEIPAYFEDQKTLDEVILVLEDRAQTVVSERR